MILCLETATNLCSVALCNSAGVITVRESNDTKSHASMLTLFIEEIFKEQGIKAHDLKAIAVSKGPGSYTGLRIGVSVAKGIAFAASLPFIAIDTTLSMFWGISSSLSYKKIIDNNTLFCPMLDARRMEVYFALYDPNGNIIRDIAAKVIDPDSFNDIPESKKIIFFGDGAAKCREALNRINAIYDLDYNISAAHMHTPVYQAYNNNHFEDIAYFEPFYLKDFITTKPRKNIFET